MFKYIVFGIGVLFITGCSFKSYNQETIYPNNVKKIKYYHSVTPMGQWCGVDGENCNGTYNNINYSDPFCDPTNGMYLQDDLGW